MSWYGKHPKVEREWVAKRVPAATCKRCIYWLRAACYTSPKDWFVGERTCPRCGTDSVELLNKIRAAVEGGTT